MLKITTPYKYEEFKRKSVGGKRLYENPYGEPVPSVTTILSKTKDMTHLNAWKKRVGEKKAQEIVTEAANVGTIMHNMLEAWSLNEEYTGTNMLQAKMMAETVIKNVEPDIDEVWGSEVNLCYPGLYAGTTDLVGIYKGNHCIMDFKQTNKPKKREWIDDYFMQAAAYGMAHNEVFGTDIKHAAIFMCSRDCDWQLWEVGPDEFEHWTEKWARRVEEFYNLS
jgi:genome maintenance exonuclease 1